MPVTTRPRGLAAVGSLVAALVAVSVPADAAQARTTPELAVAARASAAAVTAPLPASGATTSAVSVSQALTPASGVLWGAFVGQSSGTSESAVQGLEAQVGRKLDLVRFYSRWNTAMTPQPVLDAVAHGRTPVWTIAPQLVNGTKLSWASVASGAQDAQIVAHAAAVKALGVPVFLGFQHEPDYATGYGSPADYRAAYRHYVEVFRAQGVTNVAWTWVLSPGSYWSKPSTAGADAYYPGDDVVDWFGLDPYNWYGCMAGGPTAWRPMAETIAPFSAWSQSHGKPLMIAEFGSVEDPAQPGRKGAWITEAMAAVAAYPQVKAVLAYDATGNCTWDLDTSTSSLAAYRDAGASAQAHGRANAWLLPSTVQGPAPLAATFDGSRSTGTGARTGSGVTSWTLEFGDGGSTSGTGQPPSALAHTYAAGTWTATLTVRDATGSSNVDRRTVQAAQAPTVSASETGLTATGVTMNAWVKTFGTAGTATFEWGTSTTYGSSWSTNLAATGSTQAISHALTGLPSGRKVYLRITATTAAGSTTVTRSVQTPGLATFGWTSVWGRTASTATVSGGVNPNGLAGSTWVEYGRTSALGSSQAGPQLASGVTWLKQVDIGLAGLSPRTTYYFRLCVSTSAGTAGGPVQTFTTLG